jgi:hypothetical protein
VQPAALPAEPSAELNELLTRAATRLPQLATRYGIDPATVPSAPPSGADQRRRRGGKGAPATKPGVAAKPKSTATETAAPANEAATPTPDTDAVTADVEVTPPTSEPIATEAEAAPDETGPADDAQ